MKISPSLYRMINLRKATRLNLLICGAMRSGTTSLKTYMSEHSEIGFVDGEDIIVYDQYTGYYPFASPSLAQSQLGDDAQIYERICTKLAGKNGNNRLAFRPLTRQEKDTNGLPGLSSGLRIYMPRKTPQKKAKDKPVHVDHIIC